MKKECFKCKEELPLTQFYKHSGMSGGHLGKCKLCTRRDVSQHRKANIFSIREYDRSRNMREDRVSARRKYISSERGKEVKSRIVKRWVEKNPEKRQAHTKVRVAIKSGLLVREACEKCGSEKAQAHHDDYSKPLDIMWLCPKHHKERHKELENEKMRWMQCRIPGSL